MRRLGLYLTILFLTFACGVAASSFVSNYFREQRVVCKFKLEDIPRFILGEALLESEYHIYQFRFLPGTDHQQITLYGDFRSAEVTENHFEANATPSDGLIELSSRINLNGQRERRGVRIFEGGSPVRIFWTEGDVFWSIQAHTLELAREFERTDIVQSITMANTRVKQTR